MNTVDLSADEFISVPYHF